MACFDWLRNQRSQTAQLSYIDIMSSNCKVGQVMKNNRWLVPTLPCLAWKVLSGVYFL